MCSEGVVSGDSLSVQYMSEQARERGAWLGICSNLSWLKTSSTFPYSYLGCDVHGSARGSFSGNDLQMELASWASHNPVPGTEQPPGALKTIQHTV